MQGKAETLSFASTVCCVSALDDSHGGNLSAQEGEGGGRFSEGMTENRFFFFLKGISILDID